MKKFLAILLALAMILALAACGAKTEAPVVAPTEPAAPSEPTEPAAPSVAPGTSWNAVEGYHREEDPTSVWQYYFFDPQDSSYNLMMQFLDHEDINIHSWYPWEGSWVGIGFNNGEFCELYGNLLEQNADGPNGMMSVLGFTAPADGKYVVTGKLMNAFDQEPDLYTVVKKDGTIITQENFRDFIKGGYTFLTPTEVQLAAGEEIYFQCASTSGWVSSYADITVYYEPTDASVMEKPESVYWTPDYPELILEATAAEYNALADLNGESATAGPWVYAITEDGATFEPMTTFIEQQWDDDPEADALEWYLSAEDYVGVGINCDVEGLLEINVDESGRAAALGFMAPEDGTYAFTVYTKNVWEQASETFIVSKDGETLAEVPFTTFGNAQIIEVELAAGETVYFHGTSYEGEWVSAYANVLVNQYAADKDFNTETATDGIFVYAITADGVTFEPMGAYIEQQWDDDPEADAAEWYTSSDDYTGVGFNYDVAGYLELNADNSFENGGRSAALGFKAPAAGTYELTVATLNAWGQVADSVVVSVDGETVGSVEFLDVPFARTITVTLEEGQIAYIYGISGGDWVSFYVNVGVNQVG